MYCLAPNKTDKVFILKEPASGILVELKAPLGTIDPSSVYRRHCGAQSKSGISGTPDQQCGLFERACTVHQTGLNSCFSVHELGDLGQVISHLCGLGSSSLKW